jgi:hypothetical protein
LWSVVTRLKRGQAPDVDPTSLSARVAGKPNGAFIRILIAFGLRWFLSDLSEHMWRGED